MFALREDIALAQNGTPSLPLGALLGHGPRRAPRASAARGALTRLSAAARGQEQEMRQRTETLKQGEARLQDMMQQCVPCPAPRFLTVSSCWGEGRYVSS